MFLKPGKPILKMPNHLNKIGQMDRLCSNEPKRKQILDWEGFKWLNCMNMQKNSQRVGSKFKDKMEINQLKYQTRWNWSLKYLLVKKNQAFQMERIRGLKE